MALTDRAGFRDKVKRALYIKLATTTFDTDITSLVDRAVTSLPPQVLLPSAPVESTVNSDQESVTYPAGVFHVARLDIKLDGDDFWKPYALTRNWNGKVYLSDQFDSGTDVRLWPLVAAEVKDCPKPDNTTSTTTTLPLHYDDIVVFRTVSYFYDLLAGNKRKYNSYVAASGAAGDRDMKDSSDFYEDKAQETINERVPQAHRAG